MHTLLLLLVEVVLESKHVTVHRLSPNDDVENSIHANPKYAVVERKDGCKSLVDVLSHVDLSRKKRSNINFFKSTFIPSLLEFD